MNKLTIGGLILAVGGPVIVAALGISDSCGSELAGKLAEFAPVVVGSIAALIGHKKTSNELGAAREALAGRA